MVLDSRGVHLPYLLIVGIAVAFLRSLIVYLARYRLIESHRNLKLPLCSKLSIARMWPEAHQLPRFCLKQKGMEEDLVLR